MITMKVKLKLPGFKKFSKVMQRDLRGTGMGPIRRAIKQWAFIYRSFAMERFDKFSKGGGNWKKLAESTIAARRGNIASILRDTGTLMGALAPTWTRKPGAIEQHIPFGVIVGYGGPGTYRKKPGRDAAGKFTKSAEMPSIADIAHAHQTGARNLPKREIIVRPKRSAIRQMEQVMKKAMLEVANSGRV